MAEVNLEILARHFPEHAIKSRDGGGGKSLSYIDGATAIRRLIEATGNNYSFEVVPEATQFLDGGMDKYGKPEQIMLVLGKLTLPGIGTRMAFGVQRFKNPIQNADDLLKAAATDALKKAASLFGVALELYGPDLEAGESASPPQPDNVSPIRRQDAAIQRVEQVAGAHTVPERQPRTQTINGTTQPVPPAKPYGDYAPKSCNMAVVDAYLKENGFTGGNMGECIRELESWAAEQFPGQPKVQGTGDWEEKYKKHKTWPSDVYNFAAHFIALCKDTGDPAVTAAAGGITVPDDDEVPF